MSKFLRKDKKNKIIRSKAHNKTKNGLTPSMRVFVDEWLISRNATDAYQMAFPKIKKTNAVAAALGCEMLKRKEVAKYIDRKLEKASQKVDIDIEWVLKRYKQLIEFTVRDFLNSDGELKPLDEIPKDILYAVHGFKNWKQIIREKNGKTKITKTSLLDLKFSDKKGVLDSLGKFLGMFEKDNEQKRDVVINVGLVD